MVTAMAMIEHFPRHRAGLGERAVRALSRLLAVCLYAAAAGAVWVLVQPLVERFVAPNEPAAVGSLVAVEPEFDKVRRGDTLQLLAMRNGTSVPELVALNPEADALALATRAKEVRVR